MKKRLVLAIAALLPLAIALAASQKTAPVEQAGLAPTQAQAVAGSLMYGYLSASRFAYRSLPLDDQLSKVIYKNYLESLDGNRMFFLDADIKQFNTWETELDDAIKNEDFSPAFSIFKTYLQRVDQRTAHARSLLKQEFDFTVKESYAFDREEAAWASTDTELNELWRKSVKNDVLRLKLAGRSMPEIRSTLDKRYADLAKRLHKLDSEEVFENFMNAYGNAIDPHTAYFAPRSADNFNMGMKLSLEGVGAVLQEQDGVVVFRTIMPGSPAEKTGQIKPGDRVLAVGQDEKGAMVDVQDWGINDVVAKIRGPKGSVVRLEMQSGAEGADGSTKIVRIVRDKIKLEEQAASKKIISQGGKRIGVIELPAFYLDFEAARRGDADVRSATSDVRKLLVELKAAKVDGVVMDLRSNGGGALPEAIELTGLFIKQGPVVQVRGSNGEVEVGGDTDPEVLWTGPLAVLVNRSSASASEIFAAAIQDYGRGLIIGEPTFGKGTVQQVVDFNRHPMAKNMPLGELHMTVAQFFRINGGTTQNAAVSPDVPFPVTVDGDEYGESTYKNALPYTEIAPSMFNRLGSFKNINPQLVERHKQRAANNTEFAWWMQDVNEFKALRANKTLSLNEQERLAERERLKAKRSAREAERKRLGLKSIALDNNDDGLQANERKVSEQIAQENAVKDLPDPLLNESVAILADAIVLLEADKPLLTRVFPKAQSAGVWTE
jgi:carboxyl-terminal processing protease